MTESSRRSSCVAPPASRYGTDRVLITRVFMHMQSMYFWFHEMRRVLHAYDPFSPQFLAVPCCTLQEHHCYFTRFVLRYKLRLLLPHLKSSMKCDRIYIKERVTIVPSITYSSKFEQAATLGVQDCALDPSTTQVRIPSLHH